MSDSTDNAQALLRVVRDALEEKKGVDIVALEVREMTTVTDFMLIASGASTRHVKSLADGVVEQAKQAGFPALGVEGEAAAEWILVDLGAVVAHIMLPQTRAFYQLERLWSLPGRTPGREWPR